MADMKTAVLELIKRSKDHLVAVIDAITLPYYMIGSPLGLSGGKAYERYFAEVEKQAGVYSKAPWIGEMRQIIKQFTPKL